MFVSVASEANTTNNKRFKIQISNVSEAYNPGTSAISNRQSCRTIREANTIKYHSRRDVRTYPGWALEGIITQNKYRTGKVDSIIQFADKHENDVSIVFRSPFPVRYLLNNSSCLMFIARGALSYPFVCTRQILNCVTAKGQVLTLERSACASSSIEQKIYCFSCWRIVKTLNYSLL